MTASPTIDHTCPRCGRTSQLDAPGEIPRIARQLLALLVCPECEQPPEPAADPRPARAQRGGLPTSFWDTGLAAIIPTSDQLPILAACLLWVGQGGGLFITGDVGTGKTTLAAAALWDLYATRPGAFLTVPDMMMRSRAEFGSSSHASLQALVARPGALVLDDLGAERATRQGSELLFALIDARIQARAPLLVTSNLLVSEIAERHGVRLASRIAGYCRQHALAGPDLRLTLRP